MTTSLAICINILRPYLGSQLCDALYYSTLHCTALHCTALHCTALHCTALNCTALHCTAEQCTALHCTALHCAAHFSALDCPTAGSEVTSSWASFLKLSMIKFERGNLDFSSLPWPLHFRASIWKSPRSLAILHLKVSAFTGISHNLWRLLSMGRARGQSWGRVAEWPLTHKHCRPISHSLGYLVWQ